MPSLRVLVVVLIGLWATPATAGRGLSLLRYLPEDVAVVVGFNVAHGRGRALTRIGLDTMSSQLGGLWLALLGAPLDPARDLDTVLVASRPGEGDALGGFLGVLEGRLDAAERFFQASPSVQVQGVAVWAFGDLSAFSIHKRLVFCSTPMLARVIATARGARRSAKRARAAASLRAAAVDADPRGDVWIAMRGSAVQAQLPVPGTVRWVSGSAAAQAGLVLEVRAETDAEATAVALLDWMTAQMSLVRQVLSSQGLESMADSIEVRTTGAQVVVALTMSDTEFSSLLASVAQSGGTTGGAKSP